MDYEKAYKEALERAKKLHKDAITLQLEQDIKDYEYIFPELKESEDERIRKELLEHCRNTRCVTEEGAEGIAKWIAWLEKQGDSSIKWNKNTKDRKPQVNHSVLMQTTHGIAEGEWQGEQWHQYRWASIVRDSDVLSWMELSILENEDKLCHSISTT